MHFSLLSGERALGSPVCYFEMHTEQRTVYSPFYANRREALEQMRKLVVRLRRGPVGNNSLIKRRDGVYYLRLFGQGRPAVGAGAFYAQREDAVQALTHWQGMARAPVFEVLLFELERGKYEARSLKQLDFRDGDLAYHWEDVGSTLIVVDGKRMFGFKPAVGLQAGMPGGPCEPIFSALRPFASANLPLFHGRKRETEELYTLIGKRKLTLLYGAPRVGKTSLVQCGIANRIDKRKERLIVIKRGRGHIIEELIKELRKEAKIGNDREEPETFDPHWLTERLDRSFEGRYVLIFDQLEKLFEAEILDAERAALFSFIRRLATEREGDFRVVLVLREAFLAPLAEHEREMKELLENRYRLLPLKEGSMVNATFNMLDVLSARKLIDTDDPRLVSEKVCRQLANDRGEVPMHCLQIYLHQLHQRSCAESNGSPVPLNAELIDRMPPAQQLIDSFYTERLANLHRERQRMNVAPDPSLQQEIEELQQSRLKCGCEDRNNRSYAAAAATGMIAAPVPTESGSVLPWGLLAYMLGLPLLLLSGWLLFSNTVSGGDGGDGLPTACAIAADDDSCEALVNYLCRYGEDDPVCAADFRERLEARDCRIWNDYLLLEKTATCGAYQQFFRRYRDSGVCMDFVSARLLEWECPIVRDTVMLTQVDTVVRRVPGPTIFSSTPTLPAVGQNPPCAQFTGLNFKSVGPLWIMTEALDGGPYRWEDALDACTARGYRLPCIGEIDFLIEKIYRDDPDRAYVMLAGSGECVLVNPNETTGGRVEFWTATEANDATAWSYYFDVPSQTIGRQSATPKSARLPCLCVRKDPAQNGSGLPPCYQKQVDRRPAN